MVTYRTPGTDAAVAIELDAHGVEPTAIHLPVPGESPPAFKARVAADFALDWTIDDSPEVLAAMPNGRVGRDSAMRRYSTPRAGSCLL